jgi:hypothetical protein
VRPPRFYDQRLRLRWSLVVLRVARVAAAGQGLGSAFAVALDPLVDGRATHAETLGEFGDGVEAVLGGPGGGGAPTLRDKKERS